MTTRLLTRVSAAIEAATGIALIAVPELVARVLLGAGLSDGGIAFGRVAGCGLLALSVACWPAGSVESPKTIRALVVYNLLAGFYLGYLRVGGAFVSYLLWPACALHILLGLLLARPAFAGVSIARARRSNPQ